MPVERLFVAVLSCLSSAIEKNRCHVVPSNTTAGCDVTHEYTLVESSGSGPITGAASSVHTRPSAEVARPMLYMFAQFDVTSAATVGDSKYITNWAPSHATVGALIPPANGPSPGAWRTKPRSV